MKNSHWIKNARRIYSWLLRLYPREYRAEYGAEMAHVFTDQCREAVDQGNSFRLFALWIHTLIDLVKTAAYENLSSPNIKLGLLEAVPNSPLPWKGVTLVLIPGLLFFISQLGQLEGTNWFYLAVYRASYFLMIPVLLVWWRTKKFPIWGLIPLGLFFNNLFDLGYRLQVRMINPDRLIWKAILPLLKNIEGVGNLYIAFVFLILIALVGWIYFRHHPISRTSLALLIIYVLVGLGQMGLTSYIYITSAYHTWDWARFFTRTEFFMLSPLWLQDIYFSVGFLLLITIGTLLASKHGELAILFPLGYLLASILYGSYQPSYPDQRSYIIIAISIIVYRLVVTLITPILIVRSLGERKRKMAIIIPIGIALILQAGVIFIHPYFDESPSVQTISILSSLVDTLLIGIGLALAVLLYGHNDNELFHEKGNIIAQA